jgi:predicted nucleic acid-binding protein
MIYRPHVKDKLVAISFVTVGELLFGARKRKWGSAKIAELDRRIQAAVIVPYDRELCDTYADLKVKLETAGRPVADNDLWIAASAVRHNAPLISNNRKHYEHIPDLVLISEAPAVKEIGSQMSIPGTKTGSDAKE